MAILSFSLTSKKFLEGKKTVTRRDWSQKHYRMWVGLWEKDKLVHDAWDNIPIAGGKRIGRFKLTSRPYKEQLKDMPPQDLEAEGGMCSTLEDFYELIGKSPEEFVTVVRFEKLQL